MCADVGMYVMHSYMLLLPVNVQSQKNYIKRVICKDSPMVCFMNTNPER